MFLQGLEKVKDGYKLTTVSDNDTQQTTVIPSYVIYETQGNDVIDRFMDNMRYNVDLAGQFYVRGFSLKDRDGLKVLAMKGSAPVGRVTGQVQIEVFFFFRDTEDMSRETEEENLLYLDALSINKLIKDYEEMSLFVEKHFVNWCGLKTQLEIFKEDIKKMGAVSRISHN